VHQDQHYVGEHPAIVNRELFDKVQALLASGASARRRANLASASILTGRIFDDRGNRMTPTHAQKNGDLPVTIESARLSSLLDRLGGRRSDQSGPKRARDCLRALRRPD
jgi:hypothetical protein